jgi:hypothetical protein
MLAALRRSMILFAIAAARADGAASRVFALHAVPGVLLLGLGSGLLLLLGVPGLGIGWLIAHVAVAVVAAGVVRSSLLERPTTGGAA